MVVVKIEILLYILIFNNFIYLLFRPHKSQIVSTLSSSVFNGAEVVVDDSYASELPDKSNLRMYVQQQGGSGK